MRLKQNFRKLNVLDLEKDAYSQLEVHPTHLEHENLQRFTKVRTMGVACKFQPLREGYRSWASGFGMPRSLQGRKLDAAYEFINWFLDG